MGVRISACQLAVPPGTEDNSQLAARIGKTADWILLSTGVEHRRIADHDDDPIELAAKVAQQVIEEVGPPDLLIYAGAIPRQTLPDSSAHVLGRLGLSGVPGFSVNAACLSFAVAVRSACAVLESDPAVNRVLICCAEFASRGRNFTQPESAALLGDGAAAAILESCDGECGLKHWSMQTFPEGADLTEVRGGGLRHPFTEPSGTEHLFEMDGPALLRFTVPRMRRFLNSFLKDAGLSPQDLDLIVPHQPSGRALEVLELFGFPNSRVVKIIRDYGNCVAASLPMALATAMQEGRINRGDLILLTGTAAGVSLAAGVFQW